MTRNADRSPSRSPDHGGRELACWAAGHGIDYLDGAIMATPEMIGTPQASLR